MNMILNAYRGDEEPFRVVRLTELRDELDLRALAGPIAQLHERKGLLCVDWWRWPTTRHLRQVIELWQSAGEEFSNHFLNGQPILMDDPGYNPFA